MTPILAGIIGIILFFLLMALRVPIALAMAMVGVGGIVCLNSPAAARSRMAKRPVSPLMGRDSSRTNFIPL